jgi:hypothetical protein
MNEAYTEDLSDFGYREQDLAKDIFVAWQKNGLPEDFYNDGVKIAFNRNSGYVFLTNFHYQVCMEVEGKLESYYTTPYEGVEGFLIELIDEYNDLHPEDQEYVNSIKENLSN